MSDLGSWLLERIAEDEGAARGAGKWFAVDFLSIENADHADRHTPARVLATVRAHRAIVEMAEEANGLDSTVDLECRVGPRDTQAEPYLGDLILRALASIYADEPPRKQRKP